jgi:hypothetical protein
MRSDFSGARRFLERASEALRGSDHTSERMRTTIDLLIEVAMKEECSRHDDDDAKVLPFRRGER